MQYVNTYIQVEEIKTERVTRKSKTEAVLQRRSMLSLV